MKTEPREEKILNPPEGTFGICFCVFWVLDIKVSFLEVVDSFVGTTKATFPPVLVDCAAEADVSNLAFECIGSLELGVVMSIGTTSLVASFGRSCFDLLLFLFQLLSCRWLLHLHFLLLLLLLLFFPRSFQTLDRSLMQLFLLTQQCLGLLFLLRHLLKFLRLFVEFCSIAS